MIATMPSWLSMSSEWLPIYIFLARTLDVSISTVRIIVVARGRKYLAFCLGFIEIMIWLTAIGAALTHLSSLLHIVSYAGGFAMGNFVGIILEEKIIASKWLLRIFALKDEGKLIQCIQEKGYGVTQVGALGGSGAVKMLYTIIERQDFPALAKALQKEDPDIFYTVESIRSARKGIFPLRKGTFKI